MIEHGFCQCGCGAKTPIARQSITKTGIVRGQPTRFIRNHNRKHATPEYIVNADTGCWEWTRSKVSGYGRKVDPLTGKLVMAHRWFYEQRNGEISEGLELDHLCRNRRCVNPEHLEAVTRTVNIRRCPATKLTHESAIEIRSLYAGGLTAPEIAPKFGIGLSQVYRIAHGESWAS